MCTSVVTISTLIAPLGPFSFPGSQHSHPVSWPCFPKTICGSWQHSPNGPQPQPVPASRGRCSSQWGRRGWRVPYFLACWLYLAQLVTFRAECLVASLRCASPGHPPVSTVSSLPRVLQATSVPTQALSALGKGEASSRVWSACSSLGVPGIRVAC